MTAKELTTAICKVLSEKKGKEIVYIDVEKKTSLLPVGIKAVQGDFVRGDVVGCLAPDGTEIARGLVNYDSSQLRLIAGKHCEEFAAILGFSGPEEAVHRDSMVMIAGKDNQAP